MLRDQPGRRDIDDLEAEVASLRTDKSRLDWLEAQSTTAQPVIKFYAPDRDDAEDDYWLLEVGNRDAVGGTIREAIDAARKEST